MPPRYAYWTILVDGGPTAFRAAEPDELLPTLKRLQVKQPGAIMKWFEKGRLWESREEAKDKLSEGYTVGPDGALVPPPEGFERRTKSWRPGGEHRDPREKYQLAKKAKWQKFKQMVRARPGHGKKDEEGVFAALDATNDPSAPTEALDPEAFDLPDGPADDHARDEAAAGSTDWRGRPAPDGQVPAPKRSWSDRPKTFDRDSDRPRGPKPAWRDKPPGGGWSSKPGGGGGARPAWKPRPDARGPKPEWRDRPTPAGDPSFGDRPRGPKPEWRDKPPGGGWRGKPGGSGGARPAWKPRPDGAPRPEWRDKPKTFDRGDDRPRGPKPEWRDRPKPAGDRPVGDRPRGPRPEWRDKPKTDWRDKPKTFDRGDDRPRGPKPEWRDRPKPAGDRPVGDRPRGPRPEWRDKPRPGGSGSRPPGRSGPPKKRGR